MFPVPAYTLQLLVRRLQNKGAKMVSAQYLVLQINKIMTQSSFFVYAGQGLSLYSVPNQTHVQRVCGHEQYSASENRANAVMSHRRMGSQ